MKTTEQRRHCDQPLKLYVGNGPTVLHNILHPIQLVSSTATIMDMDTTTVSSLVISVPFLYQGDDYTFPDMPPLNMEMESNATSRIVTYSGDQPIQTYIELMLGFQYRSSLDEPDVRASRMATIQVFSPSDVPGESVGSNTASVMITVVPVNNNSPEFTESIYYGNIAENAATGTPIGVIVSAMDGDIFGRTDIAYMTSDTFFFVDPVSGTIISQAPLDAESVTQYDFMVTATDNDVPTSLTSSVLVSVNITDLNDNTPIFNQTRYSASIREDSSVGAVILTISASDADITMANSGVTYAISGLEQMGSGSGIEPVTLIENLPFEIDALSGEISLASSLDFDAGITSYEFSVLAMDSGPSPLMASVPVRVVVTDANDNPPQFSNLPFSFTVSEDTPFPSPIVSIMASDPDTGINSQIEFTLQGTTVFSINSNTGLLSLNEPLDFETVQSYNFVVVATDFGSPRLSSQATVSMAVVNVNDNPPTFIPSSYTFNVRENTPFLMELEASDVDGQVVTFREISGFGSEFQLNPFTDEISNTPGFTLDYELQSFYFLVVEASDSVFTTLANVSINIQDVNDLPPEFTQDIYIADIIESLPLGTPVVQVTAEDGDTSSNAFIEYDLQPQDMFSIDRTTGIISVASSLDFDSHPTSYTMNVTARNTVPPQFSDSAIVIVTLLDANDIEPQLVIEQSNITFRENSDPIFIASDIQVIDGDSALYPVVGCSIVMTRSCPSTGITPCDESIFLNEILALQLGLSIQIADEATESMIIVIGNSTTASYTSLLQTLQYANSAPEPVSGVRSVEIQCQDPDFSSNILVISVFVQLRNEFCPVITASSDSANFTEGSTGLAVGSLVQFTLSDQDSVPHNTLQSLSIVLNNRLDGASESISIADDSTGLVVTSSDTSDTSGSGVDASTQTLSLQSPEAPLPVSVFSVALNSLMYTNQHPEPRVSPRQISIYPMDPSQGCTPLAISINIIPINDNSPELVFATNTALQYVEDSGPLAFASRAGLMVSDLDHNSIFFMQSSTVILDGILDTNSEIILYDGSFLPFGVSASISQEGTIQSLHSTFY